MEKSPTLPSDRKFGFLFVVVFSIAAIVSFRHGNAFFKPFVVLALVTLLLSLLRPQWLHPANRAWMAFGLLLSKFVTPIVLGVLFFVLFAPLAIVMRLVGRDAMRLKANPAAKSHWIARDPPGPAPESLREQG